MEKINWYIKVFPSLHSLYLVECDSHENYSMTSLTHELLRQIIFNKNFTELTEIELITNKGLVLDKNLQSNLLLTRLTISLRTIDDLLVLLDGLLPNLIELEVILCTNHVSRRLLLPLKSTVCQMIHLTKFQLTTEDAVEMRSEYLLNIVKFLRQLNTFIICIDNWTSADGMFIQGNQIEMFINQFMPCLQHFHCFMRTQCRIDMTTFIGLNQRWPILCRQKCNDSYNHLYTIPWTFEDLETSVLAEEDTMSISHDVLDLIVDTPCSNLSQRFPNIEKLTILCPCDLNGSSFPRLRWLITEDIAVVSMIGQYIHTLELIGRSEYSTHSTIYPHICYLTLENIQSSSLTTTMSLVQYFPNLRSLNICFSMSEDYFDSLDVLLDNQHLPHLMLFRTNWITDVDHTMPEIKLWLLEKTILKWRSKRFLASRVGDDWTVWF